MWFNSVGVSSLLPFVHCRSEHIYSNRCEVYLYCMRKQCSSSMMLCVKKRQISVHVAWVILLPPYRPALAYSDMVVFKLLVYAVLCCSSMCVRLSFGTHFITFSAHRLQTDLCVLKGSNKWKLKQKKIFNKKEKKYKTEE